MYTVLYFSFFGKYVTPINLKFFLCYEVHTLDDYGIYSVVLQLSTVTMIFTLTSQCGTHGYNMQQ